MLSQNEEKKQAGQNKLNVGSCFWRDGFLMIRFELILFDGFGRLDKKSVFNVGDMMMMVECIQIQCNDMCGGDDG